MNESNQSFRGVYSVDDAEYACTGSLADVGPITQEDLECIAGLMKRMPANVHDSKVKSCRSWERESEQWQVNAKTFIEEVDAQTVGEVLEKVKVWRPECDFVTDLPLDKVVSALIPGYTPGCILDSDRKVVCYQR
jgi:hypothetical protein